MNLDLQFSDQPGLQIAPYLAEALCLKADSECWLHVGKMKERVSIAIHNAYPRINLNKSIAKELKLNPGKWQIKREQDGIRLGPVIGIVCKELTKWPPMESNWTRYLEALPAGLCILLTPESFDWERKVVIGRIQVGDQWQDGEYPWPDALYIQLYPLPESFKSLLDQEFYHRYFNFQTHFDKWLIAKTLEKREELQAYLPETAIFSDDQKQLKTWLLKYGQVYLKPVYRSQGLGIIKASLQGEDCLLEFRESRQNKQVQIPLTASVREKIKKVMGRRQYLIQQAILLPQVKQRTSDLRVLVQKKEDGSWHITALGARRGAPRSIVNNIDNGGERITIRKFLGKGNKTEIVQEIFELCRNIAICIEEELGILGEIGVDLGLDENGRIWIIEVNGRPDKTFFTHFYAASVARNAYTAPVLYSTFLSGFSEVINPLYGQSNKEAGPDG